MRARRGPKTIRSACYLPTASPTATTAQNRRQFLCFHFRRQLTHRPSPRPTWTPSAQLPNFSLVIPQGAIPMPAGLENNGPSPRANAVKHYIALSRPQALPANFGRVSFPTSALSVWGFKCWLTKATCTPPTRTSSYSSDSRSPPLRRVRNAQWALRSLRSF